MVEMTRWYSHVEVIPLLVRSSRPSIRITPQFWYFVAPRIDSGVQKLLHTLKYLDSAVKPRNDENRRLVESGGMWGFAFVDKRENESVISRSEK